MVPAEHRFAHAPTSGWRVSYMRFFRMTIFCFPLKSPAYRLGNTMNFILCAICAVGFGLMAPLKLLEALALSSRRAPARLSLVHAAVCAGLCFLSVMGAHSILQDGEVASARAKADDDARKAAEDAQAAKQEEEAAKAADQEDLADAQKMGLSLADYRQAKSEAERAHEKCVQEIVNNATYGAESPFLTSSYEWVATETAITVRGNDVKVKNAFGALANSSYACEYSRKDQIATITQLSSF
jgi:hypothetical protein